MTKYFKVFANDADYRNYTRSTGYVKPNISVCKLEDHIHYAPYVSVVVAKFNVTSTTEPTSIGYN